MKREFSRYGFENLRVLTGSLEILGGIGLLVGFKIPAVLFVSCAGLALLMFFAVIVRLKIKDGFLLSLPALLLMLMNLYIFYCFI